ncbi:DUF5753 domain-containing protein [Actinoplanes sp. RD1]|uniref:DUF5753 domain-containing protein n=1 Tax=Actinoplanes sp. RD1 TaxID=3064538 RepID=UPI0027421758|nr:DUF5753 domain-containing protein [Actinoplanes sp. RD1]
MVVAHRNASEAFARLLELEPTVGHLWHNQPLVLPGLLQTEEYATALIAALGGLRPGDPELIDRVGLRLRRGAAFLARLRGADPPSFTVVIDEAVLVRGVLPAEAMARQLDHLREVAELPTVRLGIVPLAAGAHATQTGSFEVYDDRAVFVESAEGDRLLTDLGTVRRCQQLVEAALASAATGPEALALLRGAARAG